MMEPKKYEEDKIFGRDLQKKPTYGELLSENVTSKLDEWFAKIKLSFKLAASSIPLSVPKFLAEEVPSEIVRNRKQLE